MKKDNKTWLISKAVIQAGDIEPILLPVDPEQLSDAQIYGLHGQVRLRIPGTNGPQDIFCDPVARAVMISDEPHFEKLGEDYSRLILSVGGMIGELACSCFDPTDEAAIHQQLVAYPLSFYVTLKPELIRLRLYVK